MGDFDAVPRIEAASGRDIVPDGVTAMQRLFLLAYAHERRSGSESKAVARTAESAPPAVGASSK